MPHRTQMQVIKRRLVGKEGTERVRELRAILAELPNYRGGGRALLGVLRDAEAMVLCHDLSAPLAALEGIRAEFAAAGIELPTLLAATKADEAPPGAIERLAATLPELELVAVSVLDEASLDALRDAVWRLTGLVRIYLRDEEPVALHPPVSVLDVAGTIHHELADSCRGARVWGPSARFEGQRVGRDHLLADGDTVEILT